MYKNKIDYLLLFVLLLLSLVVILRSGVYPAASAADDAWFSEAAYYFSKELSLKRPWLDDEFNGANVDFFPPITSILQGVIFFLFGISQFTLGVLSSIGIVTATLMSYVYLKFKKLGNTDILIACIALWGLQIVLEQSVRVRPELWTFIYALGSLYYFERAVEKRSNYNYFI